MRKSTYLKMATITATSCLALLANTANAKDAPTLTIKNFIGTIDVKTGDYDKVTVTNADGADVSRLGASVLIDDDQTIKKANCRKSNTSIKISVGGWKWYKLKRSYKNLKEYPQLKITAPENTHLVIDNAIIFGDVDNIGSADIQLRSCSDLDLSNVDGHIDLRIAGSGDLTMENAGTGDIRIAGSGDFTAQHMQSVEIALAGSGDVQIGDIVGTATIGSAGSGDNKIGSVGGDFSFSGAGSGDLDVGNIGGDADITTAGSGDVEIGRLEGNLSYTSGGSGDFDADFVGGEKLSSKSGGSGTVEIDGGNVTELYIKVGGSGDARYDGKSTNANLYAGGSGEITIREPSGTLVKEKHGSGSIHIR